MSEAAPLSIAKKSVGWSIFISVCMILAGLMAIALPEVASFAVTLVVGWLLIFSAVMHFVFAWHARGSGGVLWEVLLGILYGGIGIYLITHPLLGVASLTFALAVYLLVEGVIEGVLAFRLRPRAGWGWLMFDSVVTILLGILIWVHWPSSSLFIMGTLVGISMLFSGITRLMLSFAARRLVSGLPGAAAAH
jgi:uncharacterized membrane protein HdeD (DUF308 family)